MNIDELCSEVNRILVERGIEVTDGRTASTVTPRNVRYYQTIGMVSPPRRDHRRAEYDPSHVDEIVAIKKAQSEGISLEELRRERRVQRSSVDLRSFSTTVPAVLFSPRDTSPMWTPKSLALNHFELSSHPDTAVTHQTADFKPVAGWSLRIGEITVSGTGLPLEQHQIDALVQILGGGHESG